MKKSRFNLTRDYSTTLDAGYLVPFLLQDCLPNDSFRIGIKSFIRAQPMLAPLMHRVHFYTQYWFVPYRILWDEFEEAITQGNSGTLNVAIPKVSSGAEGQPSGSLWDYFGFPIGVPNITLDAFPFLAYNAIWKNRYADEDLQNQEIDNLVDYWVDGTTTGNSVQKNLLSPSWKKDYFTTARAGTQRGNQISVPIFTGSGISGKRYFGVSYKIDYSSIGSISLKSCSFGFVLANFVPAFTAEEIEKLKTASSATPDLPTTLTFTLSGDLLSSSVTKALSVTCSALPMQDTAYVSNSPTELGISCQKGSGPTTATITGTSPEYIYSFESEIIESGSLDIRDLRLASALQRYQERSLKWGNRYEEFIMREFGIRPRDARIDRPEYLGGGRSILNISEVLQTAEATDTFVGTMRGHGVGSLNQRPIRFTAPEHGLIIGLLSVRPTPVYTQGVPRLWDRKSYLDFFIPELANVGMQEVFQKELFATENDGNANVVFGYQDRYSQYRYEPPIVTGEFRNVLSFWNMARQFPTAPVINSSFINMANSTDTFKRPFAVKNQHSYLAMLVNDVRVWRVVPKRAKNILK